MALADHRHRRNSGLPRHAVAQDYPTRSVTILVPFAPGGSTDLIARAVGQKLEHRLGQPLTSSTLS
jgi:tripartite-type tricarboxylate transporter receptor subunit TctC